MNGAAASRRFRFSLISERLKVSEQQACHLLFIPIVDDGPVDVKRRSYQIPTAPLADLFGRLFIPGDIDFPVSDLVLIQPDPGPPAGRAPIITVQHQLPISRAVSLLVLNFLPLLRGSRLSSFLPILWGNDSPQLFKKHLILRPLINIVNMGILDNPLFIDDINSPFRSAITPENIISFSNRSVGPEIT